jgi:hypothetical protein
MIASCIIKNVNLHTFLCMGIFCIKINKKGIDMKKKFLSKILSMVIAIQFIFQLLTPAFAQTRNIYDPLAMLEMLKENPITPSINLPTSDIQPNIPQLPNTMISPQAYDKPSELITGPQNTSRYQSMVNPKTGKLDLESYDINVSALGFDLKLARFKSDEVGAF